MSRRQFGAWIGTPMSERDIDDLLASTGWGILSLAQDGEAYGLPVSFGYDGGDRVFLVFLETNPPQRKVEFAQETARACLNVSAVRGRFDWQSVVITGSLRELSQDSDEWDALLAAVDDNAWFSSAFTRDPAIEDVRGYVLEIEELSGLEKHEE